ncbi:MAG: NADAR domain-containing protein, partial [Candidatus Roizmanbacteria bacterium]
METTFAYFVDGELIVINRDEGERMIQYNLRVKFITEHHTKYDLPQLHTYSRMYANRILFGTSYPKIQTMILDAIINGEEAVSTTTSEEDELEEVKELVEEAKIEKVSSTSIELENGIILNPAGPGSIFAVISEDNPGTVNFNLQDSLKIEDTLNITDIVFEKPNKNSSKEGVVLEVTNTETSEIVEVVSCADPLCQEGGPIVASSSNVEEADDTVIILKPPPVEKILRFMSATDDNGFLSLTLDDLKCFATKLEISHEQDDNIGKLRREISKTTVSIEQQVIFMTECLTVKFSEPELASQLAKTGSATLVYASEEPYWGTVWGVHTNDSTESQSENRLGKILMKIRDEPKQGETSSPDAPVPAPEETKKRVKINTCNEFLNEPLQEVLINELRSEVTNKMLAQATEASPVDLSLLLREYDSTFTKDEVQAAIENKQIEVIVQWKTDLPAPAIVNENDTKFTLSINQATIDKLFTADSPATEQVFGITVKSKLEVVQIFIESFLIDIFIHLCASMKDKPRLALAKAIFGHQNDSLSFGTSEASTMPPNVAKESNPVEETATPTPTPPSIPVPV